MNEPKKPAGVPWKFWAAWLAAGGLLIGIYHRNPPPFEHTHPQLTIQGEKITAEFDATNHSRESVVKTLNLSIGVRNLNGSKGRPYYSPSEFQKITVSLAPSETQHIRCEFQKPVGIRALPNMAEIRILE